MIENILVAVAVIVAFYMVIRFILKKLAGNSEVSPCQGCGGCSMSTRQKAQENCNGPIGDGCRTTLTDKNQGG